MKKGKEINRPENILDRSDWWEMMRAMNTITPHLIKGLPEMDFLLFLQGRTFFYGKFSEMIVPSQYINGFPQTGHLGIKDRKAFSRAQKDLSDREVIKYFINRYGYKTVATVRINMWGILDFWVQAIAKKSVGKEKEKWEVRYKRLVELKSKVEKVFLAHNWRLWKIIPPEKGKMKLKDHIEKGKKMGEPSRIKRKEKRLQKELTPEILRRHLIDLCDEYGEAFMDDWAGREWRSAKNLIQYYEESGKDLRKHLREVVEHWHKFHDAGILSRDGGKPVRFSRVVDFGQFFKYRREIYGFIVEEKEKEKEKGDKPKYHIIDDSEDPSPRVALEDMTFDPDEWKKKKRSIYAQEEN